MGGGCRTGCLNGIQTRSLEMPLLSHSTCAALLRCDFLLLVSQKIIEHGGGEAMS